MASGSILAAILVLAVVIFVHELGHFLVGKWCNVEVRVFSMGFGPTLFARKVGETVYRIALIPLGGYVKMAGYEEEGGDSEDAPSDPARGFTSKPLWQRAAIVAAGPAVNIAFAVLILFGCALAYGVAVPTPAAVIADVAVDKPAAVAGIGAGDTVVSVDGSEISTWDEMVAAIGASGGRVLEFGVLSPDGAPRTVEVTPALVEQRDAYGEAAGPMVYQIGVRRGIEFVSVGPIEAMSAAVERTWMDSSMIVGTVVRLIQGRVSAGDLGGPIMVVAAASQQAQSGLQPLLFFMALISINLGIVNLLPIPILDGGHLMFMSFEAVRGRPLPLRVREYALGFGMMLIGTLMLFVVFHDILRLVVG
ncbi:MAG: RIP metalloprotease RseP [Candidatus Binatia bacterium]